MSPESKNLDTFVHAEVPLGEMFGYATAIRSLSKGRASYTMEPSHFEQVPAQIVAAAFDPKGTYSRQKASASPSPPKANIIPPSIKRPLANRGREKEPGEKEPARKPYPPT